MEVFLISFWVKKNYDKLMWKTIHQVSGAGIRTHNLLIISLLR